MDRSIWDPSLRTVQSFLKRAVLLTLALLAGGCSTLGYYAQAVGGHLAVMRAARSIDDLVADPATDPALKKRLEQVGAAREFASRELALPDNGSYRAYADLGRPFVVWNVFAAPEFSVDPEQWCLPFAGCVSYRGYYDKANAEGFAAQLRQEGFDTHVAGVPAYSTLGYFNDPILNTFLRFGEWEAARVIFHELAHQLLYVRDDTLFNESFATAVEAEGMRRWLARSATAEQRQAYEAHQRRKAQFIALVADFRDRLRTVYIVYTAGRGPEEQRRAKAETMAEMKRSYAELKAGWGAYAGYDHWFAGEPNNAKIASVALYTQWVPAFERLLEQEGRDLPRFYRRVADLARLPQEKRLASLRELLPPSDRARVAQSRP